MDSKSRHGARLSLLSVIVFMGCQSHSNSALDPNVAGPKATKSRTWHCADISETTLNHVSRDNKQVYVHEIPHESVHNYVLLRQFEIQEYRLVCHLLKHRRELPKELFNKRPIVSMSCMLIHSQEKTLRKRLQLQFIGRRIARVVNPSPQLRLGPNNLIVVGRYTTPFSLNRKAIKTESSSIIDYEVNCERFIDFRLRLEAARQ